MENLLYIIRPIFFITVGFVIITIWEFVLWIKTKKVKKLIEAIIWLIVSLLLFGYCCMDILNQDHITISGEYLGYNRDGYRRKITIDADDRDKHIVCYLSPSLLKELNLEEGERCEITYSKRMKAVISVKK